MLDVSKYNLDKDKNVLGKKWFLTYGGWFADEENFQLFIDAVKPLLPSRELDILYMASASGLLGERLILSLGKGKLTLVDISQEHLDENNNHNTKKIRGDLLEMNLNKQYDLILMRSSLDYFPSRSMQIKVLKIVANHLKPDGLFINQPAYISLSKERDIISEAYNVTDKIGKRLFQSDDLDSIYKEAGLIVPVKIGEGKIMIITQEDHVQRYGIDKDDLDKIVNILKKAIGSNVEITKDGYVLKFEFPIFMSKIRSK